MMEQVVLRYQQYMDTMGRWGDGLATEEEMQAAIRAYEESCLTFQQQAPLCIYGKRGPLANVRDQQKIEHVFAGLGISGYQLNRDTWIYYVEGTEKQLTDLVASLDAFFPGALVMHLKPR